jgi:phosphoglycolate phosphatase-like HAD superfamily hydrolase
MLNVLYPRINWEKIDVVGFDLDGTLYDEFEFIVQAYTAIVDYFEINFVDEYAALNFMKDKWFEKGSSYNRLFEITYDTHIKKNMISKEKFVNQSLDIFRSLKPKLVLNNRNKALLNYFYEHFDLFLVTDGNYSLQKRKFKALELDCYFKSENTVFTGKLGDDFYKPNIKCKECLELDLDNKNVLYIGDRSVDKGFAKAAGYDFLKVYNMIPKK